MGIVLPIGKANLPGPRVRRKFAFRYPIYGTKATDEEDDPLGPDEFRKFTHASTTVAKNDTHWNPIN
jgi:hypothetical protein